MKEVCLNSKAGNFQSLVVKVRLILVSQFTNKILFIQSLM